MGGAFSPDGRASTTAARTRGASSCWMSRRAGSSGAIDLNVGGFVDSFVGDLALSRDGRRLLAVDQFNYRLAIVDVRVAARRPVGARRAQSVCGRVLAGRAVRVGVERRHVRVSAGAGRDGRDAAPTAGLAFPGLRRAVEGSGGGDDGRIGDSVPGLGSPNHPDAMSVFKVDLADRAASRRASRPATSSASIATTSRPSAARARARSSPARGSSTCRTRRTTPSRSSTRASGQVAGQIELNVPGLEQLRGVLPFGMALTPGRDAALRRVRRPERRRGRRSCADGASRATFRPAGFASIVALAPGEPHAARQQRQGARLGSERRPRLRRSAARRAPGRHHAGHAADRRRAGRRARSPPTRARSSPTPIVSREVAGDAARRRPAIPILAAAPIRHVVFIVKENRTFDQVFGQRAGVRGDPTLADARASGDGDEQGRLARARARGRLAEPPGAGRPVRLSDNFYCDSDQSNTGHRWVVGVYPNEWVEVNARSRIEARLFSSAPGRRYVAGSSADGPAGGLQRSRRALGAPRAPPRLVLQLRLRHRDAGVARGAGLQGHRHPDERQLPDAQAALRPHVAEVSDLQHGDPGSVPRGHVRGGAARAVGERPRSRSRGS